MGQEGEAQLGAAADPLPQTIPAKVTVGSFCSSDPTPAGFSQAVSIPIQPQQEPGPHTTVTINPAAMPAGTELSFGTFQLGNSLETSAALINTDSYTCTTTAPHDTPDRRRVAALARLSIMRVSRSS